MRGRLALLGSLAVLVAQDAANAQPPTSCRQNPLIDLSKIKSDGSCMNNFECDQTSCPCLQDPKNPGQWYRSLCVGCAGKPGQKMCTRLPICDDSDFVYGNCYNGKACKLQQPNYLDPERQVFQCEDTCSPGNYANFDCSPTSPDPQDALKIYPSYPPYRYQAPVLKANGSYANYSDYILQPRPVLCTEYVQPSPFDPDFETLMTQQTSVWGRNFDAYYQDCRLLTIAAIRTPSICTGVKGCQAMLDNKGQKCAFPDNCPTKTCESIPNEYPFNQTFCQSSNWCTAPTSTRVCWAQCMRKTPKIALVVPNSCQPCPSGFYKNVHGDSPSLCRPCYPDFTSSGDRTYCCQGDCSPVYDKRNCYYTNWSDWGECSSGTQSRYRDLGSPWLNIYPWPTSIPYPTCTDLVEERSCAGGLGTGSLIGIVVAIVVVIGGAAGGVGYYIYTSQKPQNMKKRRRQGNDNSKAGRNGAANGSIPAGKTDEEAKREELVRPLLDTPSHHV